MKKSTTTDKLLCLLMHNPKLLTEAKVDKLKLDGEQATLLNTCRMLWLDEKTPTPESLSLVKGLSEKTVDYAAGLFAREVPSVTFHQLIDSVLDEQRLYEVAEVCSKYHKAAISGEETGDKILSRMLGDVMNLSCEESSSTMTLGSDFSEFEKELRWRQEHPGAIRGLPTGFRSVDRVLNGFQRKGYYVLGARPSVGKTAWMCNVIEALCDEGYAVGTWSLEMPKDKLQTRCLAAKARVPLSSYSDTILTIAEMKAISGAQRQMKKWRWFVNDNQDCTIDQIEAQATLLHRQGNLDILCVDYLQIINIVSKLDRYEQVGEISQRIRNLGRRLNIPTVALAQLRRKEGKFIASKGKTEFPPPEISDLRESGNIEQDADGIMLLERDIRDEEMKKKGKLDVAKNRGGATTNSPIELNYKPELTLFSES